MMAEQWKILSETESENIWNTVYQEFDFRPNFKTTEDVYSLKQAYDLYDCSGALYMADTDINWTTTIQDIFSQVLDPSQKDIYALTWQHTDFLYDPHIKLSSDDPTSEENTVWRYEGTNHYYPRFYPDGEYHIFLAKDFSWGYLTDPWREHIFVFGDRLQELIRNEADFLKFKRIKSQ